MPPQMNLHKWIGRLQVSALQDEKTTAENKSMNAQDEAGRLRTQVHALALSKF